MSDSIVRLTTDEDGDDDDDDDFDWKDDWGDILLYDDDETEAPTTNARMNSPSPEAGSNTAIRITEKEEAAIPSSSKTDDLRSEDDDDGYLYFGNDDNHSEEIISTGGAIPRRPPISSQRQDDLWKELEAYVSSLGTLSMLSSVNRLLQDEYNTPQKALELVHYYTERPALAEYTRTKELPRMDYQVLIDDDDGHHMTIERNQEIIARDYLPDSSILARSANQSILADLLQALTGPNQVVRPQYLAMCVAENCQFRIILHHDSSGEDPQPQPQQGPRDSSSQLQVHCTLQLSLPVMAEEGSRLHIATIHTTTQFSPHQQQEHHYYEPPVVMFKVDKIVVLLQESEFYKLQHVVDFLMTTMEGHLDQHLAVGFVDNDKALQDATPDRYRDAFFLESSQKLMTQSKAGFKSALQDVESVMGIQSKLQAVRGGFSKLLLPDTNILLAAEEEEEEDATRFATERERRTLPFGPRMDPNPGGLTTVPSSTPLPVLLHPVPPGALPNPNSERLERPKSILGELVKSGWGALAKSIAIPDEGDPAIYGGSTLSQQQQPEEESRSRPTLYRK